MSEQRVTTWEPEVGESGKRRLGMRPAPGGGWVNLKDHLRECAEKDAQIKELKEQVLGWIKENGPGGWIEGLRVTVKEQAEEIERLTKTNDLLDRSLDSWTEVCVCGCPISEHENYGEEGESCEHEDHQCLRTCPGIAEMFVVERTARESAEARVRALEGALRRIEDHRGLAPWGDAGKLADIAARALRGGGE